MGALVLSYNEKAETLAASLPAMFQCMNEQSKPTVTEMVNEVMPAYTFLLPVNGINEPRWCSRGQIKGLKFGKVPNPHGISNRVLRHPLTQPGDSLSHDGVNFLLALQHARDIAIHKTSKDDTALPSSH
jgi:hypothetical protein